MAGKKIDTKSLIHLELEKLEKKVNEFQKYLQDNPIVRLEEEDSDKLHREIVIQIKIQDALFSWLPLLEKLRSVDDGKSGNTRGDVDISPMFK